MEYKKNDLVTVTIEDIGTEGEGIGKIDGFPLFIKDAVVGDTVEAKIIKAKKNYAYARLEKVLSPSPYRTEPKCPYHRQCGGCQIQALSYEKQLEFKENKVRNNLLRIGGFSQELLTEIMEPIVGMEEPYHYRNKAQYPVGTDKEGRIITGFYAGRTHSIIANTECYLGVPQNKEILEIILQYMEENHVTAYDEETGKGQVRHVLIRTGFTSGEIMVCLVINGSYQGKKGQKTGAFLPRQELLLERLAAVEGMRSISVSINTEKTNVIMGKEIHTLWGEPTISDVIHVRDMQVEGYLFTGHELTFKISPLSFYQVNPVQTEKLYSLALEYAGLTGQETVWDLYCGIGTISLFLANKAKQVYGVEIIPQAIEDAKENARRNGIENAEFFVGKAEEVLPEYYERVSKEKALRNDGVVQSVSVDKTVGDGRAVGVSTCQSSSDMMGKNVGDGRAVGVSTCQLSNDMMGKNIGDGRAVGVSTCQSHNDMVGKNVGDRRNVGASTRQSSSDMVGKNVGDSMTAGASATADMLHPDVIVVDPPRKGCDEACLETMLKMQPKRIVYVSCDSATMARDVKILCEGGYELKKVRAVDQFGHTVHVETVVLLSQQKPDDVIEVEIELDELDLTSAESKATYKEIQEYVLKEHGLKVSNLYISQVKRKCGIEVGENYNLPKSEDSKQPQCPEEKEKAIKDALEHFGMV